MQATFQDRAPLERVRRLKDGRIAAVAKFARSGCYRYTGSEVGRPDLTTVTVYRPDDEVFAADAMASFAHKAITLDHPGDAVTASNWSKVAVGFTEGRVARDGGFIEIPLMLADAAAVEAYDSGAARELSAGYTCELVWGDGIAPDGTAFQATQKHLRGDHIALVPRGRAGSDCRVGDSIPPATFNDAAITAFRDSDEGRELLAYERYKHRLSDRHGTAFDAGTERTVLAAALVSKLQPRHGQISDAAMAGGKAQEDAAYQRSIEALTTRRR
jgi:hypothetical protein